MSKLMGSEWSGILITRLLLLTFLLLWQLDTGATSQNGTTPVEADALQDLVNSLRTNETEHVFLNLNCSNDEDAEIKCDCDNSTEACSVTQMDLSNNMLTGTIPSLAKLHRLKELDLSNNMLTGSIPDSLTTLGCLQYLRLRFNVLNDTIPKSLDRISSLESLDLFSNSLSGRIPPELGNLHALSFLNLDDNNLEGKLPTELGNLVNLRSLDLSFNNLNGNIPETLQKLNKLYAGGQNVTLGKHHYHNDTSTTSFNLSPSEDWAYSFSGDYLWATINESTLVRNSTCEVSNVQGDLDNNFRLAPVSLIYYGRCLRKGKYNVQLRFAETLYSKGEDNSRVGKRVFDVYIQNKLEYKDLNIKELPGKENEGRKLSFQTKIHNGSLEIKFYWAGKGSLYNPPAINGPLISAISVTKAVVFCFQSYKTTSLANRGNYSKLYFVSAAAVGLYVENGLDRRQRTTRPTRKLGDGRSGIVYKAELPDLTVAVKKLDPKSKAVDEIRSEVYAKKVLDLKHDNLVKLLAPYSRRDLHLLIYEFMELGSLGKVLFDPNVQLDWPKRFTICSGIAKGLQYLHGRNPQIIHRNMKANNILLNANYDAKITDFGLAKLYEEESSYHIMQAGRDASYMAPEYATRGAITVKVDVYSFGILLLEIVSGKNNADYSRNQESVFLLDTAGKLHARGKLAELVDARMDRYNCDQANTILNLAIMCVDLSPSNRPTMSQILSVFEGEKTIEEISKEVNTSA
ncbi:unnamed protein product [Dovyalis caffra]|uniref:non-specific serine/threonine protein kinase n=1 Tax=Dovyalis caffra TaxID=77055 RepID=A0AAV1S3B0_9ROSI|nr:unnamed protein product [Dovyalis caffra]